MSRLILHIGTPKTGTTALQKFLFDNRSSFADKGVAYPQFTPQKNLAFGQHRNGIFLSRYCRARVLRQDLSRRLNDCEENLAILTDTLKENDTVILSDENFFLFANESSVELRDPECYWRELEAVVNEMGVSDVDIIVYLRRQDRFLVSFWKERIKSGMSRSEFGEAMEASGIESMLDYASVLDNISSSFGSSAKIIVRSYDKVMASDSDIYHDFLEALGIPWDDKYEVSEQGANRSISFDVAEAIRTLEYGRHSRGPEERRVRVKLALALSRRFPDPKGVTVYRPGEAESLMEKYREGNRRIEERYFKNEKLFGDEFPEGKTWRPDKLRIAICRAAFIRPELPLRLPGKLMSR